MYGGFRFDFEQLEKGLRHDTVRQVHQGLRSKALLLEHVVPAQTDSKVHKAERLVRHARASVVPSVSSPSSLSFIIDTVNINSLSLQFIKALKRIRETTLLTRLN